jgi:SAM-dependent methyltransferase
VEDREYEGTDLIEVMDQARRYNAFLGQLIADALDDCRSVLDFGAGDGRFSEMIANRGFQVTAVEPDPELRSRIEGRGVPTVPRLPEEGNWDGIYSTNVLEHIEDDVGIARHMSRLIRDGGRVVTYVPAFQALYSANDARVGHFRRYRRSSLKRVMERAGLRVLHAEYVDSIGFIAGLGYRLQSADGSMNPQAVKVYDRVVFPMSRVLDRAGLKWIGGKNLLVIATRP